MQSILLPAHILAVIVWVGGMFFAHFCLRPAAMETLEPPQRLRLMEAALRRFFVVVAVAVVVLLASGFVLFFDLGFARAPAGWHLMMGSGLAMALIFAFIALVLYPRFRSQCEQSAWPAAAKALDAIRRLVAVNLALGVGTVIAVMGWR